MIKPVFSGYFFVGYGINRTDWRKINSTFGAARLVNFNGSESSIMPKELLEGLWERFKKVMQLKPGNEFKLGNTVKVISGFFRFHR